MIKKIYYRCRRFVLRYKPSRILRQALWFVQRGKRGWADCDVWNLDEYYTKLMLETLRRLEANLHSYPSEFDKSSDGLKQWRKILKTIIAGLEAKRRIQDFYIYPELQADWEALRRENPPLNSPSALRADFYEKIIRLRKKDERKFKKAMLLLVQYFDSLWD